MSAAYEMSRDTAALLIDLEKAGQDARAAARRIGAQIDTILDREREIAGEKACAWAREVLDDPAAVVLDSETTGLRSPVEAEVSTRAAATLFAMQHDLIQDTA